MSAAAIVTLLTSLFKAIPVLGKKFDEIVAAYVIKQKAKLSKELRDGIKRAINEQDQIELEQVMGYQHAGEESHLPGAVVVDSLPGLHKS
jgi:hypothetical protein